MSSSKQTTKDQVQQLQLIEHNLNSLLQQKQQFHAQQLEADAALKEIASSSSAFKIIGNIMVAKDNATLTSDLEERKEMAAIRIKNIEKRESELKSRVKELQDEVMKALGEKNDK